MKKGIQLVALLLTVVMTSCTGGKDKAALKQEDEKPRVKVADVTARPVDQIKDYQRSEVGTDGCSQSDTNETATGQSENRI